MNYYSKIKNSTFFKSIFQLAFGSILAQLITVLCSPFLTRIYSVEDMGMYALLLTVISIFGSVINGKYDFAIVSTKDEKDIDGLVQVSFLFSIVATILIVIFFSSYLIFIADIKNNIILIMLLIFLLLLIVGIVNILNSINNRMQNYKIISEVYVIRTSIQNFLLLILGMFNFGPVGMLGAQVIGNLMGIRKQYKTTNISNVFNKNLDFKRLVFIVKKYKSFPMFSMSANILNNISYSILNFFISGLFGMTSLGLYSMSYKILGLPLSLISVNVSKVFFRDAAEEYKDYGRYNKALFKSTILLTSLAIPMCIILFAFSPIIFEIAFGKDWRVAGEYAKILAPMFSIRLVVGSLVPAFIVCNKQRFELLFQSLFVFSSIANYIFAYFLEWTIETFLTSYSIMNVIIYFILYVIIFKLGRGKKYEQKD
ncbi:Membrane protein involved in the export of O-antigen and teichoic acid [Enterococcus casseliflavus]|uniref:oligosaccharide flippase family protein n=1 Tax=Enterococcus casseliflavus TaxID=37734 RepID=UPI0008ED9A2C|nr:oligosaccharide flippase family protein [Enterococcus casseliflavus]SFD37201.1 Membrane protein involved in the export of O-antigen and teichoic acid [Enterococcus casseliflavus]